LTKHEPEKALLKPLKKSGGRNNLGRVTSRHRGGGHKRMYRVIDFLRGKHGMERRLLQLNMIRTDRRALRCSSIRTVPKAIFWRRMD